MSFSHEATGPFSGAARPRQIPTPDPICTDGREILRLRIGNAHEGAPTLVYLPGLHGDWTMMGAFRSKLGKSIRLVEFTYPRTLEWSLDDYADAIETMLRQEGIDRPWLLGESFGSQILWTLVRRDAIRWQGLILAGGFVRYPFLPMLQTVQKLGPMVPVTMLQRMLPAYVHFSRLRHGHESEAVEGAREFVARRTPLDLEAAWWRLELIRTHDPREVAAGTRIPVHHLYGMIDPIVPWGPVASWLQSHCGALRGSRPLLACDHTVLATGAEESAAQVRQWMA